MWNRVSGKSIDPRDDLPSQSRRRNDDEERRPARRSGSIASPISNKKSSSWADGREPRGFNPTSTSYSSTTRGQYPGAASASIASSYATASGNNNDEPYMAPGLVRNASLADQMPRSSLSRSSRDQGEARETRHEKRDKTERSDSRDQHIERRQKGNKREKKGRGLRRSENGSDEGVGTSRGPEDFLDQVASSGFSQFPGQYDGAIPGPNGAPPEHPAMSSHVRDQFPGQFPAQSSAPYRPPLAASEGGPGLAAEYYGDDGQSVAEQPGNRANTPSLIIGAEPHLQPALAVAAPPPEPSASGAVGAAASFFSGEFEGDEVASSHSQQNSTTNATGHTRPNSNYHPSSASIISTTGGPAIGSAAGYFIDSQASSHPQFPDDETSIGGALTEYSTSTTHRPPSQTQNTHFSSISRPPKPGKQSSQSSNIPMYAVGAAGATGLVAAAYEHNHHSSIQNLSSTPQYSTTSMAQRRSNYGPFGALVDFFKDPEGVAQFEEYSQIIGVCRHCFAPGSSSKDAPRKHLYGRRRSNERYGSSTRVDKDSRYYSSENEGRRKNNKSWLATGLAGYGLAKVGESLVKEKNNSGDTYSLKTGRFSPDGRDRRARRRSRSKERVETGITGDGKSDRRQPRDDTSTGTKRTTFSSSRHSRTRSRSKDRKTGLTEAAIGAALEPSVVASSSRRRSRSRKESSVKGKHNSQEISPERRRKTKKKRDGGVFGFGNGSSSSSSLDLAYAGSQDKHRSSKRSNGKSKDDLKAEAALLGLGAAAAAAFTLKNGRQSHGKKGVRELVGVKETKDRQGHGSRQAHRSKKSSENLDDELWESAAEDDYESMNSDLAYGALVRRDSRASLSSESSGTNKWGWRWGSKKNRRASSLRRKSSDHSGFPGVAGTAGQGLQGVAMTSQDQRQGSAMDSTSSLPLQHVHPVPTSDPSRFDVGREGSIASSSRPAISSRPEAVPLQHPRPIAPVAAAIYSSQTAYDHSYSAPTGPAVISQTPYYHPPGTSDARHDAHEPNIPGSFPHFEQQADDTARDFRIRRRDTSPARFGEDSISSSVAPRRRTFAKDDSSAVRFDLTEEQEERDRLERRQKRKEDKERREVEEQEQVEKDRRVSKEQSSKKSGAKTKPEEVPERSFEKVWAGSAAAGVMGAAVGAAAAIDRSRSEETREERRERRRRERELEDQEDVLSKSERRRRQRERDDQEAAAKERGTLPDDVSASREYADHQERSPERQDMSVWQEAATTKRSSSHESYGAFFTPLEFLNKSSDQVKITSANADADIDLEQVPQIVTVEPKRIHDLSDSPAFSLADNDDKIDPSKLSFPWQVPKLRLVEPTPPSTRGSTPIPRPKDAGDEGFEEPRKEPSSSKVTWEDDQTHEYKVIAPNEDQDEFIETPSGEISGTDPVELSRSMHGRDIPGHETRPHDEGIMESSSASYGEDAEFAALLAASAEDAGFDSSIVINNPAYRRRDSPPGSNGGNMPGGFDDENEPQLDKKERKRKEKASRRQSQNDGLNGRDDDAIVQDIISQVEEPESQPSNQVPSEKSHDQWESTKKTGSGKTKKGRKDSESRENFFETSEIASEALNSESHDGYGSPTEDVRSIASISKEVESGRKSHKKSRRDSSGLDGAASTVSSPSTTEADKGPKANPKDKRKSSIWDRVLGKSTGSLPQENGAKDVIDETMTEAFEGSKKKSKKSKDRKSTRDRDDYYHSKERSSTGGPSRQVSGRISQDLPAKVYTPVSSGRALSKQLLIRSQDQGTSLPPTFSDAGSMAQYLDYGIGSVQVEDKQPDSFLEMRPEPPPPPDTRAESEGPSDPLETTSLPTSPRAESETQNRRFSDAEISHPTHPTPALPSSPTAIPFYFRRPGRSSSTTRSLSQTPLSSKKSVADLAPKQKPRSRSTEFKSSKEIRPLWLVERHRSHQEPTLDEIYSSLPSSHTTSKSSSVHDVDASENHQRGDYELNEAEHESIEVEPAPMISTDSHPIQSDLLDSQQATPTASSFQDSRTVQDLPSPQASRDSSPKVIAKEIPHQPTSTLKSGVLATILGGTAADALSEALESNDPSRQDLSREENEDFEHGLDDMVLDTVTFPSYIDTLDQGEDFVPQKTKKGKKNKRRAGKIQQETVQSSFAGAVEATPSAISVDPEPLSPERMLQIQAQDAQDAVDSWFPSVLPSNKGKKGKTGKGRALVERLPEESGPSPNTYEPPRHNLDTAVPAEGQESDTLTREMSREQIVDIMTAVAQDANKEENEASQSAAAVVQEIQTEENRSQSKGKNGKNGRKSLPRDDLPRSDLQQLEIQQKTDPQDEFPQVNLPRDDFPQSQHPKDTSLQDDPRPDSLPALSSSALEKVAFIDPFLKQGHGNVLESLEANPASQEELDRGDLTTAISPPLDLSPRATPLPDSDDDQDFLDERLGTPGPTSLDHLDDKETEIAAENTSDVPHVHDPSAVESGPQQKSQDLPAQAEQVDSGNCFAAPYNEKSEDGMKDTQSFLVEDNETTEMQEKDALLPDDVTSTTIEVDRPKHLNDKLAMEVPRENFETVVDERGAFTTKNKVKESFSVENSKIAEIQEGQDSLPNVPASEALEDYEATDLIDESAVDVYQPKTEPLEDESMRFNGKKKKGRKVKSGFSVENNQTTDAEEENEPLTKMAASKAPEYQEAIDLIDEPAIHAPKSEVVKEEPIGLIGAPTNQAPKVEVVEDKWASFDSKKKIKKAEKQKSKTLDLGSEPDETGHQFERQPDARDDMNDRPSSLATTRTSQEVSAMLGVSEIEASIGEESKEAFPSESQSEHNTQKPLEDQISGSDERNLPALYEPETPHFEDAPGDAQNDEASPNLDPSVADTTAAQAVQDILAGENNAQSATDAQKEAKMASMGMEETATDRPMKEHELNWDAPKKKKKGKKGKKNEPFSRDEGETIEPAEVSGPPSAMNTPLEQEPAADRIIEEDELDWDAPSKNKGKKGKKNEVFSLDELEMMEPAEFSGPPDAMNPRLLEQEPAVKAIDRDFSKQSKKDKKGKKGKRKGVSRAVIDFRDEAEPNVVPTEIPQDEGKAEDLSAIASDVQEEIEPSVIPAKVPQDDNKVGDLDAITRDSQDEIEPRVVPTEVLQDDDQVEDRSAFDRPSVSRDIREDAELEIVPNETPQDDSKVEDLPADGTPPMIANIGAPGGVLELSAPTELVQDNENENSREVPLEQEQDFLPPKRKKDKKKSKKSKKSNAFSVDDDETPTLGGGQIVGTKDLEKDGPKQINPSSVDVVEESRKTVQETRLEQEEDIMLPTSKKDKKKSKKSKKYNALSLDNDVPPALEDEPVSIPKDFEKEVLKQTLPSNVDVVMGKEPGTYVEGLPEEKEYREETEEAQHSEGENDDITAQSEQETAQDLNKDSEIVSNINPLDSSGDLVIVEGKRKESMHGYFDSVSAPAGASGIPHKVNLAVTPFLNKPADASEEITAYHANELKGNIVPAVETDTDPLYSLKPSKKDEKRANKVQPLTWDEVSQEPRVVLKEPSAAEDSGEPSIMRVSQDSESSKPAMSAQEIESTDIVQPGMRSEKDQGFQGSVSEEQPSQARDDNHTVVEAEQEGSYANVKQGEKGEWTNSEKLLIPKPEEDRSPGDETELAWVTATSPIREGEQTSELQARDDLDTAGEIRFDQEESTEGFEREHAPILTEPGAIDEAKDKDLSWDLPDLRAKSPEKQHKETLWDELRIEDLSSSAAPEPARETVDVVRNTEPVTNVEPLRRLDKDEPISVAEIEIFDAQEPRGYNEEHAKELERVVPNAEPVAGLEPPSGPDIDKPVPAVEVEMLDAQEQRDYNEEYAKELERQLSPLREGEGADPSHDEAGVPVFSQSSVNSVMDRPHEEEHRPLARPPALEDIIEESGSRSGSVQGSPVDREDDFSPFKSTQKRKKGKKQQPIIWEDETVTPPLELESGQGAKPSIESPKGLGSWDTDAARPLDLEEPIDQRYLEDRTTTLPIGDFNTADNEALIGNGSSSDYFTIQPIRPAEEDVGREDTHEFRRALSTEPPSSSRDRPLAREPQTHQDGHTRDDTVKAYNQDEELGSLTTDFHEKPRTEADSAEEEDEHDFDPAAPLKNTRKGKKAKKRASAKEPGPQTLGREGLMDQLQDLETPTTDTLNERMPSRQHSLPSPSQEEDELTSVVGGRPTSRGRSGSMEGVAGAVALGVGALAAESLFRINSRNEERRGKKATETGKWTDSEADIGESESSLDRGEMSVEEKEHRQTPESEKAVRAWQHHQATPPRSPRSASYKAITDHPVVGDPDQSSEPPRYRDSAIYVSGSPMISEETPYHRVVRDSGYPDTETSPIIDDDLDNLDDLTELGRGVTAGERVGHVQHQHSRAHESDERQISTSRNPFEISVEANSDYNVSVSRPKERRRSSRRRSGAASDSDDSADFGFDIQRRRRRQAMAGEPRESSPVSFTTKNRSSALFDSSPLAREETVAEPQDQDVSSRDDPVRKEPTWSFDREGSQRSREASREGRSGNIPERTSESPGYEISTGDYKDTGTSLFGGPRSYEDDLLSPSRSPRSSESRGRRRLNTISEDSADGSPLHKKDKRAVSDVASPESGVKGRRMQSPSLEDDVAGEILSTHDPISHQSWPAAGEENYAVDERSRSRNSDQLSTLSSRHSALPGVTPRHREDEYRTTSAASMQSENSIHAIIRTPDQVRSASGLSYRSSGTPPLRRVDRSASGDLRGASQKIQAKSRAKSNSQLEAEIDTGIPSSSTYDPVTDKGKSPADMANVYVSLQRNSFSGDDSTQKLTLFCRRGGVMCVGSRQCLRRVHQVCAKGKACSSWISRLDLIRLSRKTDYWRVRS